MNVEGLEGVCGRVADVDEVLGAVTVKDIGFRVIFSDGAQVFLTNHSYDPEHYICIGPERITAPSASDFGDLNRSCYHYFTLLPAGGGGSPVALLQGIG